MASIVQNLGKIIQKIDLAVGKNQSKPTLIAVSKYHSQNKVRELIDAGHRVFGESRVQEAVDKFGNIENFPSDVELHLIGPLQTNKVKDAVALFDVIHTVDRDKLAKKLAMEMKIQNKQLPCFIQVNIGNEPQKSGMPIKDVIEKLAIYRGKLGLNIVGLMCIPPVNEPPSKYFANLKILADRLNLKLLSMGMSDDFNEAIKHGTTHIRIGTAIFGERDYKVNQ